ncbi:hypothetical protein [Ehrlichia canis]|uniref:hypothetical protein n=1 Tax=Ehrlichia canis TaxID=944 RepID=UPI00003A82DA|nr:hypothetical protein [Ehrlichia canis]UKC53876.1 hypothetical protein s20019040002_000921 [Ehrlichia canis]UKC54812.1 hypothetical protein s20026770001_000920 [Ehrlichia canis]UKC55748.1 hypothetical protein s21009500007_000920 [Ehrlichia canis]
MHYNYIWIIINKNSRNPIGDSMFLLKALLPRFSKNPDSKIQKVICSNESDNCWIHIHY